MELKITNNMGKLYELERARLMGIYGRKVTLKEVYEVIGEYCGVTPTTIGLTKLANYTPSLPLAFKLAKYFDTTVDELFSAEVIDGET